MNARRRPILILLLLLLAGLPLAAADSPQFRGPNRDGIFPETGLLKSWPEGGPKLLWMAEGLGESYASVSVADGRIYTTGKHDQRGSVYAFDLDGKLLWRKEYGAEHSGNGYPGTRTTPTVDDGRLYLLSSAGLATAIDAESGDVVWQVDVFDAFGGSNIYFGVAESPLVDGPRVIFTPGGKDAAVVALDKKTGDAVWTSKGLSDKAAYCSPRLFDDGERRQIITLVSQHLVGIGPETGEVLWRHPIKVNYDIHANSPIFAGDSIYVSHGYGQGGRLFQLAADGRSVSEKWREEKLDVHHGGAVLIDGRIYGAASKKDWYCLDAASGEIAASIRRLGKGSVIYADGRLYGYLESGDVVLVDPDPANFQVVSRFKITQGSGQHWSHPVISDGVLYVRHGDVLLAFDVKDRS
ncbi:MAG: alcohol dehydrogenase [Acidobacteria bacterium]|nr:MAG: alcohol dehydrogenase [Acidobacteriota bacterium]